MLYRLETEQGSITIEKPVIGKIVSECILKYGGKVSISSGNMGKFSEFVAKIGALPELNYMDISMGRKGLDIRVPVVIRFGTSISQITEQLIADISSSVELCTGLRANSVAIVVTGLASKQISKRNIEIRG